LINEDSFESGRRLRPGKIVFFSSCPELASPSHVTPNSDVRELYYQGTVKTFALYFQGTVKKFESRMPLTAGGLPVTQ
jgi:hypothetical protein